MSYYDKLLAIQRKAIENIKEKISLCSDFELYASKKIFLEKELQKHIQELKELKEFFKTIKEETYA